MDKIQYTPGPWGVTTERSFHKPLIWIYRPRAAGGVEATVYDAELPDVFPLSAADARLIAAAPELLEALERCLSVMASATSSSAQFGVVARQARLLIARVKGERNT